jgi:glycolate oxidase FAD binding subunit
MSLALPLVAARLADIAGASNVAAKARQLAGYRIGEAAPATAVHPRSSEEVAEIIKFAAAENLAVVPCGARTKLRMGLSPLRYDLALDMAHLNRVIAYDPGDLTLSVEPGVQLNWLEGVLIEHGQFLPLEAPFTDHATVGGTIASGMDSSLRHFYGTARDYVLGMEFVTGDGVLRKSGGRVVKNVSGYDLHKLMIGSIGTLGVITRINFRTFPLPAAARTVVAEFNGAASALDLRSRLAGSKLRPLTCEILSPRAAELLATNFGGFSRPRWILAASFAGIVQVLDRCEQEMCQLAQDCGAGELRALDEGDSVLGAAGRTREFIPTALKSSTATTIVKLAVLPSQMLQVMDAATASADAAELGWAALARALGVIYFAIFSKKRGQEAWGRVSQAVNGILAACASVAGNAAIPFCPPEWNSAAPVWGLERNDIDQMRKLKAVFDPHGILAPGRFVGGI